MNRKAQVFFKGVLAGEVFETETGYGFDYNESYIELKDAMPISKTLPFKNKQYRSNVLFPFFDGLIPEGWLLKLAEQNWKLNERDRFGLLMACCKNCIGAASIIPTNNEEL